MVVCPARVELRRSARVDRRGLSPRRPARCAARGSRARRRRRGRLVARLRDQRAGARDAASRRSSAPASCPASRSRSRSTSPPPSSAAAAATRSASTGRALDSDGLIELLAALARALSDRLDRGPARRGRRRRLRPLHARRRRAGADRRRRLPRQRCGAACARRRRARRRQRRAAEAEPARHAERDAGGVGRGARGGLRRHRLGALGRDRGHDHRPPRGRLGRAASSRSARSRAASGWRSGTRRCASRSGSARAVSSLARCRGRQAKVARSLSSSRVDRHELRRSGTPFPSCARPQRRPRAGRLHQRPRAAAGAAGRRSRPHCRAAARERGRPPGLGGRHLRRLHRPAHRADQRARLRGACRRRAGIGLPSPIRRCPSSAASPATRSIAAPSAPACRACSSTRRCSCTRRTAGRMPSASPRRGRKRS